MCPGQRRAQREKWSTELVLRLASRVGELLGAPCSFIVWNMKTARKLCGANRDPNYLLETQFGDSPWHAELVAFRNRCRAAGVAPLHIDLHGKRDPKASRRVEAYTLDVGIDPLMECAADHAETGADALAWTAAEAEALKQHAVAELRSALEGVRVGRSATGPQLPVKVEGDPYLCGLWGHECEHTLSHQSVRLGVPAFQFEIPRTLRKAAMDARRDGDDAQGGLVERLARAIVKTYREVVVPIEAKKGHTALPGAMLSKDDSVTATRAHADDMLRDIALLDATDPDPQI